MNVAGVHGRTWFQGAYNLTGYEINSHTIQDKCSQDMSCTPAGTQESHWIFYGLDIQSRVGYTFQCLARGHSSYLSWSLGKVSELVADLVTVTVWVTVFLYLYASLACLHGVLSLLGLPPVMCWFLAKTTILPSYHVCVQHQCVLLVCYTLVDFCPVFNTVYFMVAWYAACVLRLVWQFMQGVVCRLLLKFPCVFRAALYQYFSKLNMNTVIWRQSLPATTWPVVPV